MTGKWKSKPKKVIETSLGKAPKDSEKVQDLSHLRKPITTSVYGLKQVLALLKTATSEVQNYITYECDVLYECRTCRSIFRSLANFILHKRNYCREKCLSGDTHNEGGGFVINEDTKTSDEDSRCATPESRIGEDPLKSDSSPEAKKKTILPIIDKLLKKQKIRILTKSTLNQDLSNKSENSDDDVIFVSEENNLVLQKIDSSNAAVFQTTVNDSEKIEESNEGLMKSQVMEIHGILDNNQAAIGTNGKICNFKTNKLSKPNIPKKDLVCSECNFTFSTEKTLTHHIKYKHNKTCIVFPCPDCKETFSNTWNVYRHLYKVHRRTTSQVRRMRSLVYSSGIRKDQEPEKKKRKLNIENEENEENQWMNNFEGDKDFQMCGGCGKRFERKAALHSHSQMCTKRIAVCNSIKNVKGGKSEIKKIEKVEQTNFVKQLKGAAKRKQPCPSIMKTTKVIEDKIMENKIEDKIMKNKTEDKTMKNKTEDKIMENKTAQSQNREEKEEEQVIGNENKNEHKAEDENEETNELEPVLDEPESITITKTAEDVVITKHSETNMNKNPLIDKILPEIEIFTISDDSSETSEKATDVKRKKNLWNFDPSTVEISGEYEEYVNDEADRCFLSKAITHLDKNELKCIPCGTTFLSLYRLLHHMSLHFSWFRFQCSKCSFMSFHKYDCTAHACNCHSTPNLLMESTVLPIPKWKVLSNSHGFREVSNDLTNNNSLDNDSDCNKMPRLESIEEKNVEKNPSETIFLDDDDMPDICTDTDAFSDTVILSDDESRESHGSIARKKGTKAGPSTFINDRPIRNRTKSVKTVQNDFIYDWGKVLKFHDNSNTSKKMKKSMDTCKK